MSSSLDRPSASLRPPRAPVLTSASAGRSGSICAATSCSGVTPSGRPRPRSRRTGPRCSKQRLRGREVEDRERGRRRASRRRRTWRCRRACTCLRRPQRRDRDRRRRPRSPRLSAVPASIDDLAVAAGPSARSSVERVENSSVRRSCRCRTPSSARPACRSPCRPRRGSWRLELVGDAAHGGLDASGSARTLVEQRRGQRWRGGRLARDGRSSATLAADDGVGAGVGLRRRCVERRCRSCR